MSADGRLPVTLVTGFLGSGKTTLLSVLLAQPEFGKAAVIINEFGEVPLDQALIERTEDHIVVLSGGCLCCAMQGDVVQTLLNLYARRASCPFDRIVIETSGLADPGPILLPLIQDAQLLPLFRVDAVIALADALQGLRELDRQSVAAKQLAIADRIILTKSDIAAPRAVELLKTRLKSLNPWASLIVANYGDVSVAWLFQPSSQRACSAAQDSGRDLHHAGHDHHGIKSFCLWFDPPLQWDAVQKAIEELSASHGEKILRIKGLLNLDGRPAAVHGVQHFLHPPAPLGKWPDGDQRSRLVFITSRLDQAEVRPYFAGL
jgi:G3E family GTPase